MWACRPSHAATLTRVETKDEVVRRSPTHTQLKDALVYYWDVGNGERCRVSFFEVTLLPGWTVRFQGLDDARRHADWPREQGLHTQETFLAVLNGSLDRFRVDRERARIRGVFFDYHLVKEVWREADHTLRERLSQMDGAAEPSLKELDSLLIRVLDESQCVHLLKELLVRHGLQARGGLGLGMEGLLFDVGPDAGTWRALSNLPTLGIVVQPGCGFDVDDLGASGATKSIAGPE